MSEGPPESPPRKRFHWLKREGIDLGDAVVQFIAVVVGIVLGFFISQWVAQRHQQDAVHEAMHAIRAELIANRAALHKNVGRVNKLATAILKSPQNQNQPPRPCYLWYGWGGAGAATVTDAAYQTSIANQALAHMPFKQAQRIAQAYGSQRTRMRSLAVIRTNILMAGPQTLGVCVVALESMVKSERILDAAYAPIIGPDKAKWPTPPPITSAMVRPKTSK